MENQHDALREDEIDPYRYVLAIRKHWVLILVLFAIGLGAGYLTARYLPKTYRVTTLIDLGQIIGQDPERIGPVASLTDIQQMIDTSGFIREILEALHLPEVPYARQITSGLSVRRDANAANLVLTLDTLEPKLGKKVIAHLSKILCRTFNYRTEAHRKAWSSEIGKLQGEIGVLEAKQAMAEFDIQKFKQAIENQKKTGEASVNMLQHESQGLKARVKELKTRISTVGLSRDQLKDMAIPLKSNAQNLLTGKGQLAQIGEKEGSLAMMLLANQIQQNLNLLLDDFDRIKRTEIEISTFQEQMAEMTARTATLEEQSKETALKSELEIQRLTNEMQSREVEKNKNLPAEIAKVKSEIDGREAQKAMIEDIKVVVPPDFMQQPVKPNRGLLVSVSGVVSLMLGVFLVFGLEWRKND